MTIAQPVNLNVSCKLHPYSLQRTRLPPGPHFPKRIGNTQGILSVFFLLTWHTLLVDYFQVVCMFFVFFFIELFPWISVCVIFFYLQIVSSVFLSHHQNYRKGIKINYIYIYKERERERESLTGLNSEIFF